METIVNISGKEVTLKSVATLPKVYKMYFQRDFFADLNLLQDYKYIIKALKGGGELNVFENVAWVMAKAYDPSLPDLERWKASFDGFAIKDIIKDIQNILSLTLGVNKTEVKKQGGSSGDPVSTETFLILCKDCNLDNSDLEGMTISMALDYIDTYLDIKNPDKKPKVQQASQAHFNSF